MVRATAEERAAVRVAFVAVCLLGLPLWAAVSGAQDARAQPWKRPRIVEIHFTPVPRAQLALWLEDHTGRFLKTLALTEAVAIRGIGNRPGASQMNGGFRWPYGRREGALPIWAQRRLAAPGAKPFRRVIFQDRRTEGLAARTSDDFSRDDYFCLSFNSAHSKRDALDAVSCASIFNSDKGRFMTEADLAAGYAEPYEDVVTHVGRMRPLSLTSPYPPRRDVTPCAGDCPDHPDLAQFDAHAREVMPDIDSVSMATPRGGEPERRLFALPAGWAPGMYRACLEINVEGDYGATFSAARHPTPLTPEGTWDTWASDFGYPYRGQPSVVYCLPFAIDESREGRFATRQPEGACTSWDTAGPGYCALGSAALLQDDHEHAPGSGVDRLFADATGDRFAVVVQPSEACQNNAPPGPVSGLELRTHPDVLEAHQWLQLEFRAAQDDVGVFRYEARVSTEPIVDVMSFIRGQPAKSASAEATELRIPVTAAPGGEVTADMGGLIARTRYYVGVRAIDGCAAAGPIQVAELTTQSRTFATVTPCFVATAAYGTPLAAEISGLRRLRDRHLMNHAPGRALVRAYYAFGPALARVIEAHPSLRVLARATLQPIVAAARHMSP